MKTGIILYIAGERDPEWEMELKGLEKDLPRAELYRLAESEDEVVNHWWELTAKGMHRILCQVAQLDADNTVRITERCMRLSG
ncbi:MAG: hypothetical protein V5B78_07140 [Desulfohalobiaceae bacterium]